MSKIQKLILLINLLYHRRVVTASEIMQICEVSERGVYRYVNTLSAANIPVHFDKRLGGYCIDPRDSFGLEDLNISDLVLLLVALHMLSEKLNDDYRKDVEALAKRILTRQPYSFEEVWETFGDHIDETTNSGNISNLVTNMIVHTSVTKQRKLSIELLDNTENANTILVKNPCLSFKQEWHLEGTALNNKTAIPISNIRKATIV